MSEPYRSKLSNQDIVLNSVRAAGDAASRQRKAHLTSAAKVIDRHTDTLVLKFREAIRFDKHGGLVLDKVRWERERDLFMLAVVENHVGRWYPALRLAIARMIDSRIEAAHTKCARDFSRNKKKILATIILLVEAHLATLSSKYGQAIQYDEYGKKLFDDGKWERERNYFLFSVVEDQIGKWSLSALREEAVDLINKAVEATQATFASDLTKLSPFEFEAHCADVLRANGWQASVTSKSGDQGVDVVARKGKLSVALQCKLYSRPIGNGAVQEAYAGKDYVCADCAAVVTNSTYTKSARKLAAATGVYLLNVLELPSLEKLIGHRHSEMNR